MNVKDVGSLEGCDLSNVMTQSVTRDIKIKDLKHNKEKTYYQLAIFI